MGRIKKSIFSMREIEMPLNPFLLAAAKSTLQKHAFVQPGGAAAADPTAPQPPPEAAPGGAPGAPPGAAAGMPPGGAPPAPGGDPAAAGGDPAAGPPMMGGFDPSQLPTMIQQAVQQAMASGGGAATPGKKGSGAGKEDAVARQLYLHNKVLVAMANAQGIQLSNDDILGPPPGTDVSAGIGGAAPGQDPNAAAAGQPDPNAQAQAQAQPAPQPQQMNFAPALAQKTAMEEFADQIGQPLAQMQFKPLHVDIPIMDALRMRTLEAGAGQQKLANTSSAAAALAELMQVMRT